MLWLWGHRSDIISSSNIAEENSNRSFWHSISFIGRGRVGYYCYFYGFKDTNPGPCTDRLACTLVKSGLGKSGPRVNLSRLKESLKNIKQDRDMHSTFRQQRPEIFRQGAATCGDATDFGLGLRGNGEVLVSRESGVGGIFVSVIWEELDETKNY
ncbi:hypothetical protein AVEN_13200-1 [Araneus ventricosus]|uniref:Uncharacterized protein n=1 Tax=Araneus ventricosus TaxID=182803 RepID=A0A4Y2PYF7_ARAVE|nr:hypothetical protein AVEN_13200-1 [Araneus ventricosus]